MITEINTFLKNYLQTDKYEILPIYNSASDRKYFRIQTDYEDFILTFSKDIAETKSFLYFSEIFEKEGIPVPKILQINQDLTIYLQEDLGNTNLLSVLLQTGETPEIENLYKKSLHQLVKLQFEVSKKIDYSFCYDFKQLNKDLILNDLNYFKFYFLQPLELTFSNSKLLSEFSELAGNIEKLSPIGFVFRDFQARNIMIHNASPYFIDYQGGMQGNPVYDLVSLLWQAKAELSMDFKNKLKTYYFQEIQNRIFISQTELEQAYQYCIIVRLLQVLGVYGFRGILQKKQHFIDSIANGISNLSYITNHPIINNYTELLQILLKLQEKETLLKINKLITNE